MTVKTLSENKCFGGVQGTYAHDSAETQCPMRFGVFVPPQAPMGRVPVLYWLSGLTCTEENFIVKAGAQRVAAELGLAIVVPDTSPRGLNIPGDAASYDFGVGAGFYVDATEAPWSRGYRMYSYIAKELPNAVAASFPVDPARSGILGHSMGGHGALTIAVKNPHAYKSVSAFAPICSPMRCPWGEKAFAGYLGGDRTRWREYDTTALLDEYGWRGPPLLVDQGTRDQFLDTQLKPELLRETCVRRNIPLELRMQEGYDHSYFFIASFIEDHLRFHARHLYETRAELRPLRRAKVPSPDSCLPCRTTSGEGRPTRHPSLNAASELSPEADCLRPRARGIQGAAPQQPVPIARARPHR